MSRISLPENLEGKYHQKHCFLSPTRLVNVFLRFTPPSMCTCDAHHLLEIRKSEVENANLIKFLYSQAEGCCLWELLLTYLYV